MKENKSLRSITCVATNHGKAGSMRKQPLCCAAIFVLALAVALPSQAQGFDVLHEFTGLDGALPEGALVRDAAGNLYGTTFAGGVGEGTVYKTTSTGETTVLLTLNGLNGEHPASALIQDQANNLYGTADGGPGDAGVVFKLSPAGEQTTLFSFPRGVDHSPRGPTGSLLMDRSGNLFGTTLIGGNGSCQFGCGTIYRLDSAGKLHVQHAFTGGADGNQPSGPLVRDANGDLYGVARFGGNLACPEYPQAGCGTVFKLARNGQLTVLHTFKGGKDGATPQPGLLLDAAGNLYGATASGGTSENGTVFQISRNRKYTIRHRFTGEDGKTPNGGLVIDPAGTIFGATQAGGADALGTVFAMSSSGTVKVLHAFTGDLDGAFPLAGLIRDAAGNLYGTAVKNFLTNQVDGDVFRITP